MQIDSHPQFWHYSPDEHVWMSDQMWSLKRDFLTEDLQPLLRACASKVVWPCRHDRTWRRTLRPDFRRGISQLQGFGLTYDLLLADRLMIDSDWPVCTLSEKYESTMQMVTDYVQQFPFAVAAGILGENCSRFYHIQSHRTSDPDK
jgi:predicted TIM-barrel fold metal-dependent hydrolase